VVTVGGEVDVVDPDVGSHLCRLLDGA
jgi:hypothetical protein